MTALARLASGLGLVTRSSGSATSPLPGVVPPSRGEISRHVSIDQAASLDSVFRAAQIIATGVKQLSIGVWRGPDEIEAPSLIRRPNVDMHRPEFFEETAMSLAFTGNAYWLHERLERGGPVLNLTIIPTSEVTVTMDPQTRERSWQWNGRTYRHHEISHLKLVRLPGHLTGLGPIQAAQVTLHGNLRIARAAGEFFDTSGIPNGVYTTDQSLSPVQARDWKEAIVTKVRPDEPAVLGNGLKYQALGLSPVDLQWLESQKFSVTQVARLFGLPASYMLAAVDGSSDTYQNQEQADIAFVRYTLMTYLREMEIALSEVLPRGNDARFKIDALLRTDTKTRYEAHQIAIQSGLYTAAYAQKIEGFPITTTQEAVNA